MDQVRSALRWGSSRLYNARLFFTSQAHRLESQLQCPHRGTPMSTALSPSELSPRPCSKKQTVCRFKLPSGNVCGELGHTSATCPHRPCDLCGLLSNPRHTKRNCPSRKTGVHHCRTCGQPGHHYGPNCPSYQPPWRVPDNEVPYLERLSLSMDVIGFSGPRNA